MINLNQTESNSFNQYEPSWKDLQSQSMQFWMTVETGRQAAYLYNNQRHNGDMTAQMNAISMISNQFKGDNFSLARKEFEFASEQLKRASVLQTANLVDGEVVKIVE